MFVREYNKKTANQTYIWLNCNDSKPTSCWINQILNAIATDSWVQFWGFHAAENVYMLQKSTRFKIEFVRVSEVNFGGLSTRIWPQVSEELGNCSSKRQIRFNAALIYPESHNCLHYPHFGVPYKLIIFFIDDQNRGK